MGSSPPKNRVIWLDLAKGIAIICTIIGHTAPYGSDIRNIIFSFHMPLFFLLSGYTIKRKEQEKTSAVLINDFKRLIIPVLITQAISIIFLISFKHDPPGFTLLTAIKKILWGNGCNYYTLKGIGATWFLIALFYARLLYRMILGIEFAYRTIFILFLALAFSLVGKKIWLPQSFDLAFVAMLFMEGGYILKNNIKEKDSVIMKVIAIFSFLIWSYYTWHEGVYIELATRMYPHFIASILLAFLGCLCVIHLSKSLSTTFISDKLVFIGKHSLDLLCIHSLDGYYQSLWEYTNYFGESEFNFLNEILSPISRVILDIVILALWVYINNNFIKKSTSRLKVDITKI